MRYSFGWCPTWCLYQWGVKTYTAAHHRGAIQKATALTLFALSVLGTARWRATQMRFLFSCDCLVITHWLLPKPQMPASCCGKVCRTTDSLGSLISALRCLISLTEKKKPQTFDLLVADRKVRGLHIGHCMSESGQFSCHPMSKSNVYWFPLIWWWRANTKQWPCCVLYLLCDRWRYERFSCTNLSTLSKTRRIWEPCWSKKDVFWYSGFFQVNLNQENMFNVSAISLLNFL